MRHGAVQSAALSVTGIVLALSIAFEIFAYAKLILSTYDPTPWHDEWDTLRLIETLQAHPGDWFSLLLSQHNEHRLFVPRLVFLTDFWLASGRAVLTLAVSYVLVLLNIAAFSVALKTLSNLGRTERVVLSLVVGCLMLSGYQASNFLWSFQVQWFAVHLFLTLSVLLLAQAASDFGNPRTYARGYRWTALCIASAVLASFSTASGLLTWPVLWFLSAWLGGRMPLPFHQPPPLSARTRHFA